MFHSKLSTSVINRLIITSESVIVICYQSLKNDQKSVADPGFPRGEAPTYYLANFSRKLHENKEILGRGGGEGGGLHSRF